MLGLTDVVSTMVRRLRKDEIGVSEAYREIITATVAICTLACLVDCGDRVTDQLSSPEH